MAKQFDFFNLKDVGLFRNRASVLIYEYFTENEKDGRTEAVDWTQLRDAMFGELSFLDYDEYIIFKIEVINPSLDEIRQRTGRRIEVIEMFSDDDGEELICFSSQPS